MLRDVTVGVQHQGQRSENTFNCGQRWSEFTCTFSPQSPMSLNDDGVTIHCFVKLFFLSFLAVLSLPLTPSQLENEDVKVKMQHCGFQVQDVGTFS